MNQINKIILSYSNKMFIFILHIIVLLFFKLIILYSLFFNNTIMEGLDNQLANDPVVLSKTNATDIEELKKKMEALKDMKSRVDMIEAQSKQNTEGIKKLSDAAKDVGSDAIGGFTPESKTPKLPKPTELN